jgi:hypothetical protein
MSVVPQRLHVRRLQALSGLHHFHSFRPSPAESPQTNEYVFSMLVWHERLLYDEETWTAGERLMNRFPSVSNGLRSLLGLNK